MSASGPVVTDVKSGAANGQSDWLRWLGERRDGLLVGTAVVYGLGYLVWSYNAWRNHLGELPAIEFQYLMAGFVPAAILAISWAAARFFSNIREGIIEAFEKFPKLRWISVAAIFGVQLAVSLGSLAAGRGWLKLGLTQKQLTKYTAPLFVAVVYLGIASGYGTRYGTSSRYLERLLDFYKYILAVFFCWYTLVLYFDLYPLLPQELGGPQPRCAYVDLVRDDVAPSSFSVLVPGASFDSANSSALKVVRSTRLNVYFSNSEYLLVRTNQDATRKIESDPRNAPLYELRKEVIRIVEWCGS